MKLDKIRELIALMDEAGLCELEVRDGDESVRLVRPSAGSAAAPPVPAAPAAEGHPLRAPMAGTFYAGPEPGADPFVTEGQAVQAGEVLCIIESMKMMNEIKADRSGVCTAVCVANGQAVRAGDVLFRIR
ncbi:MAG TPA: biotin/lipoyl-containing protein [Pseudomonadales bacterium]